MSGVDSTRGLIEKADSLYKQGKFQDAINFLSQALEITEKNKWSSSDSAGFILNLMAICHKGIGEYNKAEEYYIKSLNIREKFNGPNSIKAAEVLNNLANLYKAIGALDRAKEHHLRALKIRERKLPPNDPDIALSYNNLSNLYRETGDFSKAESLQRKALEMRQKALPAGHPDIAQSLDNLGILLSRTGKHDEAEDLFLRALEIRQKVLHPNHPHTAMTLNNLGNVYCEKNDLDSSESMHRRALEMRQKSLQPGHPDFAQSFVNMSTLYAKKGDYAIAESKLRSALEILQKIFPSTNQRIAESLSNIAFLNCRTGNQFEAELTVLRSIAITKENSAPFYSPYVIYSRLLAETTRPMTAITFSKMAVNICQEMRRNIREIGNDRLSAFDVAIEEVYEDLAELLADQGRVSEAEYVLDLLKEQEYFMSTRSIEASAGSSLAFTENELAISDHVNQCVSSLKETYKRINELMHIATRAASQNRELKSLEKEAKDCVKKLQSVLADIEKKSAENKAEDVKIQSIENYIQEGDNTTTVIRTLAAKEKFHIFLHNNGISTHFTDRNKPISSKKLNAKILEFRRVLQPDRYSILYDPLPLATELYDLILRPIEDELKDNLNILWALQGALRYIPMAALHDGNQYLVNRFPSTSLIPYATDNLNEIPKSGWRGIGIGVSAGGEGFEPLPGVPKEINGIIRDNPSTEGVMEGVRLLDDQAQWKQVCGTLTSNHFDAIHIASHFKLNPFQIETSQLLLGKGELKSLHEMNLESKIFNGSKLLALSACDTACGANATGKEVDSLAGYSLKEGGAKAVLASLWKVNDSSTSTLMQEFYRLLQVPGLSKAQALQQAQISLMNRGALSAEDEISRSQASKHYRFNYDEDQPYAHPYFWAPFILMGNWR